MFESYNKGDKDFNAIVSRLKLEKIDLVYVGGYHQESGLILRQMRDQGLQTVLMAGDALADKEFASITGPAGEGTLFTFGPDPRNKPTAKAIVEKFKAKNIDPEGYTLYTYAAMQVWSQAVAKAGTTDPKKVMDAIKAGAWDTVIGKIEYRRQGRHQADRLCRLQMGRQGRLHRDQSEGVVRLVDHLQRVERPGSPGRFCVAGTRRMRFDAVDRARRCGHLRRRKHAMKNLLTDIAGVRVGHADDAALASGVTAVIFDKPAVAAIDVRGGGPGTREGALLDLANTVERIDAIALSGGSAFGLEAGGGVQAWLAEQGRGFVVRGARDSDRARRDLFRSLERRRQEMGPLRALPRSRLRRGRRRRHDFRARQRRRRARRHHGEFQGRARLGIGGDASRRPGRGARGGQCGRQRHGRRRAVVLGGAVRNRRRIWRARIAAVVHAGHAGDAYQGRRGRDIGGKHHAGGGRHRRRR